METKKEESKNAEPANTQPAAKNSHETLFWILGGCLMLVIIVVVIAGFVYWGYKKAKTEARKNQIMIEESKKQAEKAVQSKIDQPMVGTNQNIAENPVSVPDPGVPDDIYPPAVSEKAIGYIKKIYTKGQKNYINIDYVQWLSGDEAEKAMREDGRCPKTGECIVYDDYYIRNQNSLIRSFEVAPEAEILAHIFDGTDTGGNWNENMSFSRFSQYFNSQDGQFYRTSAPFHIEIGNNKILKITEQYIP